MPSYKTKTLEKLLLEKRNYFLSKKFSNAILEIVYQMVDTYTLVMCCSQFVELKNTLSFTSLMVDSFDDLDPFALFYRTIYHL